MDRSTDSVDVARDFRDWDFGWLDVPRAIASATELRKYPMVDRDLVARWIFGNRTLLGDAAHPMYLIGTNDASQAIASTCTLSQRFRWRQPTMGS